MFAWRISTCCGDLLDQVRGRSEALQRGRQRFAVVLQPFAGARQQLLQVAARFRVQAGEEFIEVDVRGGLDSGSVAPLFSRPVAGSPGLISTVMSWRFVFGRISSVGVVVDAARIWA